VVTAALLALPSVAAADKTPPRAEFAAKAIWVSPEQINVEIRLKCEEGESFGMIADVFQQKWGVGTASGQCTGGSQYVTIQVRSSATPPWQLGTADAYLNFGTSTAYDSEARTIRIE
jgi:hypothetical protein